MRLNCAASLHDRGDCCLPCMFQQQVELHPFTSSTLSHQTAVIYPPPQHPLRACQTFCYMQEVDVSMLAAMATFGFAHKSTPQQPTSPPHRQQHAGIAMQAQLRDSGSSSSFTSKLSRSLLSTAVHGRQQQQPGLGSLQAAGQMASEQGAYSASLMLGGPVAAAAAREGLQAPVPGPDKVSQLQGVRCVPPIWQRVRQQQTESELTAPASTPCCLDMHELGSLALPAGSHHTYCCLQLPGR